MCGHGCAVSQSVSRWVVHGYLRIQQQSKDYSIALPVAAAACSGASTCQWRQWCVMPCASTVHYWNYMSQTSRRVALQRPPDRRRIVSSVSCVISYTPVARLATRQRNQRDYLRDRGSTFSTRIHVITCVTPYVACHTSTVAE